MRFRAIVTVALSLSFVAGPSYAAPAQPGSAASIASERVATWQLAPGHTASKHWRYVGIPGDLDALSGFDIRSSGPYSVRVRTHLAGGRVLLRVVDGGKVIQPRSHAYSPTGREHTFFFTGGGPKRACGHLLRLQWRSETGRPVRLKAGTFTAHYSQARHNQIACL